MQLEEKVKILSSLFTLSANLIELAIFMSAYALIQKVQTCRKGVVYEYKIGEPNFSSLDTAL